MFPTGIDLEQPSGQCHTEDMDVTVLGNRDERHDAGQVSINSCNVDVVIKENTGPNVSGVMRDGRQEVHARDGINLNSVNNLEPHDGMEFESKEEAFSFYKEYARSIGFATVTKASRRSRISGNFIDAKFVCTRYGKKRESRSLETVEPVLNADDTTVPLRKKRNRVNQSWSKTDCKACMHVKRKQDGRWIIHSFIKEHNHEIFPDEAYHFRGHRNLDIGKSNVDSSNAIRARTKKMFVSMSRQSAGYKTSKNQMGGAANQFANSKHLALDEGDAQIMLDHFISMQDENPNFFYAIDLNEEHRLRNVFWVDAKGRLDYSYFADVVFFDTTFIKNEYKLPFAPFIGVNNHFQPLVLGCALVVDESKLTYVWLLRAWLRAMGGRAPRVILTDQDKTLKEAIAEVFPDTRHCFCLWHILSKIPEKLAYVTRQDENFMGKFNKCILKSWTTEQFEKRWGKFADRFNLRNDAWFQSLYEDRELWVPTFMRGTFLAGLSTAQRSDCLNTLFDKYIQRKTTLKEFLDHYKAILQEKCEEEAKADFETWHKQPGLKSPSLFGKQMVTMYTHAIFRKFQVEVLGVVACHPRKECEDGAVRTFRVQDFEENQDFILVWNETTADISCLCHGFEFNGFLCRHALIVLQMSGVQSIPSQYVLRRWTKDAKGRQTAREQTANLESRVQRYNDLCQRGFRLGDEGSLSQESYDIALNALEEALRKCESVNSSTPSISVPTSPPRRGPHDIEEANHGNSTSKAKKKNGTSQKRQVNQEPEAISIGLQDNWHRMGPPSIQASALDCSYESQANMHGPEQLNSRTPSSDGLFGTQQPVQGMGQLNSVTPGRGDFYSNQHGMPGLGKSNSFTPIHGANYMTQQRLHGMGQLHFRAQTIPGVLDIHDDLENMDQSNVGASQSHGEASKQLHSKNISR
ncbi:hypothetical protein SLEP1_g28436 [Rubroshorea leprosula]|uniref:Protein FAR1-RELATED SEQUENCE n=1 Tax=Rubroshorea leprosula TaxID=152421 RepID=A0AAV5K312_9ROSI|nr:hypothetical protein SLEP1_g28436 [Rubroshorea leprosula]